MVFTTILKSGKDIVFTKKMPFVITITNGIVFGS